MSSTWNSGMADSGSDAVKVSMIAETVEPANELDGCAPPGANPVMDRALVMARGRGRW